MAYIDDIIIFSPNWKMNIAHIRAVLDALRVAGLTANTLKCVWGAHSLEYLGHHVGMGKVRVPEVRVRAMKDYVRPTSQKGLRAFLGTAGYYRQFVPDFSRWAGPLFGALKKGSPVKIEWGESMSDAFVYLTNALSCEHTLTMPREHNQLLVQADASMEGIGAVLSVIRDNEESPVAYYSKHLSPEEKNYTVTELDVGWWLGRLTTLQSTCLGVTSHW